MTCWSGSPTESSTRSPTSTASHSISRRSLPPPSSGSEPRLGRCSDAVLRCLDLDPRPRSGGAGGAAGAETTAGLARLGEESLVGADPGTVDRRRDRGDRTQLQLGDVALLS